MTTHRVASVLRQGGPLLAPDMPIRQAATTLIDARAAAAPVIDESGQLEGILTQKDCFKPALHASYYGEWRGHVADQMTRNPVTIDAQDDVIRAAELFLSCPHRVFPVLQDGQVTGLLHRSDVLALLLRIG